MRLSLDALAEPGRHQPLFARNGAVATSQPLAAAAGLEILRAGGNAVDAAVAMAACLPVVEPCSNGLGSDAFALIWDGRALHGLNGSGAAPASLEAEGLRGRGLQRVPAHGWDPVTVPGAVAAWGEAHRRFGRLPFGRVLEGAIMYAAGGFPVSPVVHWGWAAGVERARRVAASGPEFTEFGRVFAPDGRAPAVGETWRSPDMAATLRAIAASGGADFYRGELAERIGAFAAATGGHLTAADLAAHSSEWVAPISTRYRGVDVWEIPPNAQGIAALAALALLEGFDIAGMGPSARATHLQVEAIKLALADAHRWVADPRFASVPVAELLSAGYAGRRRALIGEEAAAPAPGDPAGSDTVYLCAADRDGMMVSWIQSNYHGFGSCVVVPGTGISLQNRGHGFSLDPAHPNVLAPGKRPFHTIIPGFITEGDRAIGPFGVMGGHMQAQGHVQLVVNTVDHGMDPQTALDAPRWRWDTGRDLSLEPAVPPQVYADLAARGHRVRAADNPGKFGRGQVIWRLGDTYVAASDPRADGVPYGW